MNIFATIAPQHRVAAITMKDIAALKRIPGLGAKTAERLVLELADRPARTRIAASYEESCVKSSRKT